MATQVEIGSAGERIVANELVGKGWKTNVDTKGPGSTDIEARGANGSGLLVQVKTAMSPSQPVSLSSDEERNIKSRATKLGWAAYEAKVQVDGSLRLIGSVMWRKLNS
jgi:hypothetical protein